MAELLTEERLSAHSVCARGQMQLPSSSDERITCVPGCILSDIEDMSIFGFIEDAAAAFSASACAQWRWFPVATPNSQDVWQATPNVLTPASTRTRASEMANRVFMQIDRQLVREENPLKTRVSLPRNHRLPMLPRPTLQGLCSFAQIRQQSMITVAKSNLLDR